MLRMRMLYIYFLYYVEAQGWGLWTIALVGNSSGRRKSQNSDQHREIRTPTALYVASP